MTRQDLIIATIRTAVPGAIGYLLAQAIALVPAVAEWIETADAVLAQSAPGWSVSAILTAIAVGAVIAAYYWLVRQLGVWFPKARPWIEGFLLGSPKAPTYTQPAVVTDVRGGVIAPDADGIVTLTGETGPEFYISLDSGDPARNRAIAEETLRRLNDDGISR